MVDFRSPLLPTHHGPHKGKSFGRIHSFLRLSPANLCATAFKKAENGKNAILRFYNPTGRTLEATLRSHYRIRKAWRCELDEKRKEPIPVAASGHEIRLSTPKKKIVTLELAF
jgi:alpha-mannosidase